MQLLTLKTVLAAIDLDGSSRTALTSARDLAAAAGARLHVLHVARTEGQSASVEDELQHAGIASHHAQVHTAAGDASHAITRTADKVRADVIVLGPHRERARHARSPGLGSTALAVVTNASVPCLVAARPLELPLDHVIVAVDLSDTSRGTLGVALSWTSALRARKSQPIVLTALHVVQTSSPEERAERSRAVDDALAPIRREAGDWAGLEMRTDVVTAADPAAGIAAYVAAHSPGLVALGTRGLGLDPVGRLGSVSARIMQAVEAPVLLVPPAMWDRYANRAAAAESP